MKYKIELVVGVGISGAYHKEVVEVECEPEDLESTAEFHLEHFITNRLDAGWSVVEEE